MFFFGKQLKQARQLIRQGELNRACRIARQADFAETSLGRRIANQLIGQLVDRAGRSSVCGDLESAWCDLTDASTIAFEKNADLVSSEKNKLVNRTVDHARTLLTSGKPGSAQTAVNLLFKRQILDRRADEVQKICTMISTAEKLAATGRMNDAASLLKETRQLQPELTFLDSRIRSYSTQQSKLADLTNELRFAINDSAWRGAREVSNRILQIAPENQVALDARRRSDTKQEKSIHQIRENEPEISTSDPINDNGIEFKSTHHNGHSTSAGEPRAKEDLPVTPPQPVPTRHQPAAEPMRSFMLWIDGVGGFLVCTREKVTIGHAVPQAGVDIPLQADIHRHHLMIKRVETGYIAQSLDPARSSGSSEGVDVGKRKDSTWEVLKDQQNIELGQGVTARFRLSHPLGRSARIEFTSRHRTEPWSDAVILLGDAVLMGPEPANHIVCPRWTQQVVVYRRDGDVLLRAPGELEVNGETFFGEVILRDGTQVAGNGFSISCEEVTVS